MVLNPEQMREAAEALGRLVAVLDAGEVECRPEQRAYLRGAVDVLDALVDTD